MKTPSCFPARPGKGRWGAVKIAVLPAVRAGYRAVVRARPDVGRARAGHAPVQTGYKPGASRVLAGCKPDACRPHAARMTDMTPATMRKMSQECLYVLPGTRRVNAKRCEAAQNITLRASRAHEGQRLTKPRPKPHPHTPPVRICRQPAPPAAPGAAFTPHALAARRALC